MARKAENLVFSMTHMSKILNARDPASVCLDKPPGCKMVFASFFSKLIHSPDTGDYQMQSRPAKNDNTSADMAVLKPQEPEVVENCENSLSY